VLDRYGTQAGRGADAPILAISALLQETERLWTAVAALLAARTQSPCLALCRLICERSIYLAYIVRDAEHVDARAEDYLLAGYRGLAQAIASAGTAIDGWKADGSHLIENGPMANYLADAVRRYGNERARSGGKRPHPWWYEVEGGPRTLIQLAERVDPKASGFSMKAAVLLVQRVCSEYVHGSFDFVDIHDGTETGPFIVRNSYEFSSTVLVPTVRNTASVHLFALASLCNTVGILDSSMTNVLGRLNTDKA